MNLSSIEERFKETQDGKCAESKGGMVATAAGGATDAGVSALKKGGNAVDAAVAAAFALGVCEPQSSGIGGQTMMLIHTGKKTVAVDGSSRAPSLAHPTSIYKADKSKGYRATTVPSTPAALFYVHKRYGRLKWSEVIESAIELASGGYKITALQNRLQEREKENFLKVKSASGAKYFLDNNEPYEEGTLFKQPELARLLRLLSEKGIGEFYTGETAKQIDSDMRENGGLLRYDDLALIPWPIERRPLKGTFRGLNIRTMPPPGAGRTLLFTLNMIDHIPAELLTSQKNEKTARLFAEIFRRALLERSDRPYEPNFFPQVNEKMLKERFAGKVVKSILKKVDKSMLPFMETEDERSGETTHLSVIDRDGIAVSLTQSIERAYGSKAAAGGLGFLYNNYLMDYEYKEPSHPYYLRPNAVPWATVAPTLIFNGEEIWMAVGSPGSERIFSAISQFLINVLDNDMDIGEAIRKPRIHCSLGGRISMEEEGFDDSITAYLESKGYRIDKRERFSFYLGAIHAVIKKRGSSGFQGVAEVRRDGTAGGI